MNEDEIKNEIKKNTDNINVPTSLKPDEVKKMLLEHRVKKRGKIKKYIAMVAAIVMIATISFSAINNTQKEKNSIVADLKKGEFSKSYLTIDTADSYEELYSMLNKVHKKNTRDYKYGESMKQDTVSSNNEESTESISDSNMTDYSETNVHVQGVDESDIVKTDGKYIYSMREDNSVTIVKADKGDMNIEATIEISDELYNGELYIKDDLLIVVGSYYKRDSSNEKSNKDIVSIDLLSRENEETKVLFYNIEDKKNPQLINTIIQDGSYSSSRLTDGYLYLFTNYYVYDYNGKDELRYYVPSVNGERIECDDIYIPSEINNDSYMVLSSVDLSDTNKIYDKKAVLATGDIFYVSNNNIYVADSLWEIDESEILKFTYHKGNIEGTGKARVAGYLNNQFSMDESDGYLRVVSTINNSNKGLSNLDINWEESESTSTTALFILDSNLNLVGKIEDLAPGERVYSVRFIEDKGYFVTYKQIDPLFSVDLSDPANPKILGELKIPGFSSYLHPYSDNLLLGIGEEIDEETGEFKGLKLSMFDVSDPTNVKEVNKLVLDKYFYSEGLYNHKAVLIDSSNKNIIGFGAQYQDNNYDMIENYLLFTYDDNNGFTNLLEYELGKDLLRNRGLYIDDVLYIVRQKYTNYEETITSISLNDYNEIKSIRN